MTALTTCRRYLFPSHGAAALLALGLLAGCHGNLATDTTVCGAESPDITRQRFSAFAATVHPVLIAKSCNDCHDGRSGKAPYAHTAPDATEAYPAARQLVDFSTVETSRLVRKVLADHNCGSNAECKNLGEVLLPEAIREWSRREGALPPPPQCAGDLESGLTVVLEGKQLSPGSLSKTTETSVRWSVTEANPLVGKAHFEVKVRGYTDKSIDSNGSYLLTAPTLATAERRLMVVSAVPTINGVPANQYANYSGVNFVVGNALYDETASVLGFPPISDYSTVIDWVKNPEGDKLGWTLVLRETTEQPSRTTRAPGCKARNYFFTYVYNNILDAKVNVGGQFVGKCTRCHGDPSQAANIAMNLSGVGSDQCLEVLMRTNFDNILGSLVILKPQGLDTTGKQSGQPGVGAHPGVVNPNSFYTFTTQELGWLSDWIRKEASGGE